MVPPRLKIASACMWQRKESRLVPWVPFILRLWCVATVAIALQSFDERAEVHNWINLCSVFIKTRFCGVQKLDCKQECWVNTYCSDVAESHAVTRSCSFIWTSKYQVNETVSLIIIALVFSSLLHVYTFNRCQNCSLVSRSKAVPGQKFLLEMNDFVCRRNSGVNLCFAS